jgi:hypothetical protein
MNSVNLTHQQLSQAINELPLAALSELADFIESLRLKLNLTSVAMNNEPEESNFLLSISGIGESSKPDLSDKDVENLAPESEPDLSGKDAENLAPKSEPDLSDKNAENLAPEIEPTRGIKEFNNEVNK